MRQVTARQPTPGAVCQTPTSASGSGYGSGLSSTPLTTLNTAVVAPMPSASVRMATMREAGRAPQRAQAVADVAQRVFEQRGPELVARALLDALHAAERARSACRRASSGVMPARDVLLGLLLDVEANLLVETALERVAPRRASGAAASASVMPIPHHRASAIPSSASSTRLTARDMRRHCASSSLSCRRPSRVSE